MLSSLDRKRKLVEKMRMESNILDSEIKIEEKMLDIKRIEEQIAKYKESIAKIDEELTT